MPPGSLNHVIRDWSDDTLRQMLDNVSGMDIVDTGAMFRKLTTRHAVRDNDIWKTAFRMPRYAIMVEKGAGSGWKTGRKIGPAGDGPGRVPRQWFSKAMDQQFPKLADAMQRTTADIISKQVDMRDIAYDKRGMNNYRMNIEL